MSEEWRAVQDYEGKYAFAYEVSNLGRVRSLDRRLRDNRWQKGRVLKQGLLNDGYYNVSLCKDHSFNSPRVHRLVARAFVDNPDNKPQVNHLDGNKVNNRADNLEWCTHDENHIHARATGLSQPPSEATLKAWQSAGVASRRIKALVHRDTSIIEFDSLLQCAHFFGKTRPAITHQVQAKGDVFTYYGWEVVILR